MSETIFSVWLGRDFLVSSPWSIQLDYRDLFFFFPEVLLVFFFFPLLQPNLSFKLLLYHVLLFSSCNILFASVTETHASLPPKKQTKTKNPPGVKFKLRFYFFGADASHFRFQSWLLCSIVPSLRLYPCWGTQNYCFFLNIKFPGILNSKVRIYWVFDIIFVSQQKGEGQKAAQRWLAIIFFQNCWTKRWESYWFWRYIWV